MAIGASASSALNIALACFVPSSSSDGTQWQTFIVFGVSCASMLIYIHICFPESPGENLQDLEKLFPNLAESKYTWRHVHKTETSIADTITYTYEEAGADTSPEYYMETVEIEKAN